MRPFIEKGQIIKMTNVNTGEVRYFASINKAAKATNNAQSNLSMYAKGKGIQLKGWKIEIVDRKDVDMNLVEF